MAHTSKTIIIASGFSLLLAIASTHAGAQSSKSEKEPEAQRTEVTKNFDLPDLAGIETFFDNLMKAIVRTYRNTIQANLEGNEAVRKAAAREKQLASAVDKKLRASPELVRKPQSVAKTTSQPQTPQKKVSQLVPSQVNAAKTAETVSPQKAIQEALKKVPEIAAVTPTPKPATIPTPAPTPAPVVGSAKLSWSIPTQRENGEPLPLSEIASYEIYVTAEDAGTSRTIRLDNRNQTQFTLKPLSEDTYYFSMVTVDTEGTYSELSQVVSKTIK